MILKTIPPLILTKLTGLVKKNEYENSLDGKRRWVSKCGRGIENSNGGSGYHKNVLGIGVKM